MRFMLQSKLFQSGYNVTIAASGQHAIQILQTGKPFDLVISDLKMPLKNGTILYLLYARNRNGQTTLQYNLKDDFDYYSY